MTMRPIFVACLLVLAVNSVTLVANLMAYFDRERVFDAVGNLEKRVVALEATQLQRQQPPQSKGQLK